jgi:hypothetical protein
MIRFILPVLAIMAAAPIIHSIDNTVLLKVLPLALFTLLVIAIHMVKRFEDRIQELRVTTHCQSELTLRTAELIGAQTTYIKAQETIMLNQFQIMCGSAEVLSRLVGAVERVADYIKTARSAEST